MQEKTDRKLEFLRTRELERQLDSDTKKTDRKLSNAENEKSDYFERSFNEKKLEILAAIASSESVTPKERANHFNIIFKDILALQKYVAASNIFLRTYDIKVYQKNIQELTNEAKELELQLLPKRKFGFKTKKPEPKPNGHVEVDGSKLNGHVNKKVVIDENFCGFTNQTDENLTLSGETIHKTDVTLSNLTNCTVKIFGSPSTLHISNIRGCKIFSGPVSTSIFADNCHDCTLVISCQQLRLHSSQKVHIYLHVTSRAIMEDCTEISLAPYNLSYPRLEDDYKESSLDRSVNNWECVDDFNWLNVEKHSPHWEVLDENKRVHNWDNVLA